MCSLNSNSRQKIADVPLFLKTSFQVYGFRGAEGAIQLDPGGPLPYSPETDSEDVLGKAKASTKT
jgi:hypothetical protein